MYLDALKATLKKYQTGKPLVWIACTNFGFKKLPQSTKQLDTEMNKCMQKTEISEWTIKRMPTLIQNAPLKGTAQTIIGQ